MKTPLARGRAVLAALQQGAGTGQWYALVDCAHHPSLFQRLGESGAPMACLFEEPEAEHARAAAPHLVDLSGASAVVDIIGEGHGRAWCMYVQSDAGFAPLLEHLRRFMKCRMRDAKGRGVDAYFAFWDPRVAADWLPGLEAEQAGDVFAQVAAFVGEVAATPDALALYRYDQGPVRVEPVALTNQAVAK